MTASPRPDEKSCGAVLYCVRDGVRLYYLVRNRGGHVGFPKGHMEAGESEADTARREILEETGRQADLDDRFRCVVSYTLPDGRTKETVFFLARFDDCDPARPLAEISEAWLVNGEETRRRITYDQERAVFDEAVARLAESAG